MEVLHNNKIMVALFIGCIMAYIYNKYVNVDNNENKNKDNTLYVFIIVFLIIYVLLYMTEDNINKVLENIDHGDPDF
jgi:uncharacterized membrane protein